VTHTGEYELLQMWEEWMLAQGRAQATLREYRYALHRLAAHTKPAKPLTEITEQDVVVFLASLGKRAHSRQLYLRAFRSFFGWAAKRGHIPTDPSEHLSPKAPSERDPDAFSPQEVGALMNAARTAAPWVGERDALAILLAYSLGLRRSELCKLAPDDIDWPGHRVKIRDSKGGKSRWVEANDLALDTLEALRPWWNGSVVGSLDPNWFTMIVHRAARSAGLPPGRRNAHMLRAAYATGLLGEGVPISIVSRLLGHSNVATTGRYLACRAPERAEAVTRLPAPIYVGGTD
jgi:site-specific recombinase XerD